MNKYCILYILLLFKTLDINLEPSGTYVNSWTAHILATFLYECFTYLAVHLVEYQIPEVLIHPTSLAYHLQAPQHGWIRIPCIAAHAYDFLSHLPWNFLDQCLQHVCGISQCTLLLSVCVFLRVHAYPTLPVQAVNSCGWEQCSPQDCKTWLFWVGTCV